MVGQATANRSRFAAEAHWAVSWADAGTRLTKAAVWRVVDGGVARSELLEQAPVITTRTTTNLRGAFPKLRAAVVLQVVNSETAAVPGAP